MTRLFLVAFLAAQTLITPPANKYSPEEDVKLGQQAASQVERQMPVMRDDEVTSFIEGVGRRLVDAIPPSLTHPEFHYTFAVVNVREINAFALPGGPMFVNRGMIEAAHTEGEVAGVMAHEISHVVLRHGTAQTSKASKYEAGAVAGAVLGAIIGGRLGGVVAQGTRFGLGATFLRFSREYERQADLEGAQIMARAGYDPRDMANMFKTIEQEARPGGPQWLSDHPNPGDRSEYISREAALLRVEQPLRETQRFDQVQAHLKGLPPAPTTEEAARTAARSTSARVENRLPAGNVDPPSSRYTRYSAPNQFRIDVPSNWRGLQGTSTVTFAPAGALGVIDGRSVFTHGVEIGLARRDTPDLQAATQELIDSLRRGNPDLTTPAAYDRSPAGNREWLHAELSNRSEATGQPEILDVFTTRLRDGHLFYLIGVAPRDDFPDYEPAFLRVVDSLLIRE